MTASPRAQREFTISELSEESGVSIRNIRAYRNHGLLPAPEKRGRSGIYSEFHLARLLSITELLGRGYNIANIQELFDSWQAGQSIDGLLGLENAMLSPIKPETALLFTYTDLKRLFGKSLSLKLVHRAVVIGLLQRKGTQFLAPRPKILQIGARLLQLGIPLSDLMDIVQDLRRQMDNASATIVNIIDRDLYGTDPTYRPSNEEARELTERLWKMRALLDDAVLSELGQSLSQALRKRFGDHLSDIYEHR